MDIQDEAYSEAMDEIKRLKEAYDIVQNHLVDAEAKVRGLEKLNLMTDDEIVLHLKTLLTRAANALENCLPALNAGVLKITSEALIAELRRAVR